MIQKIKTWLQDHPREYEMLRYVFAGGLTTLLSFIVFSYFCIAVSVTHTVNGATENQATIGNVVSWVLSVLFAFWINRRMVFRHQSKDSFTALRELGQFVLSRLASGAVFEIGLFRLLASLGVSHVLNWLVKTALVTVSNYVVSKFWIFTEKPQGQAEDGEKTR